MEGDPNYPNIKELIPVLGYMGLKIAKGFNKLNWHWWPAYSALNTISLNKRPIDNYIRPSNIGDPTGAKGSTNHTYLPLAIKQGLVLKENCIVSKINSEKGKVKSIDYIDERENFCKAFAKIFILTSSGIGTPRLLLNSKNAEHPKGLANSNDLVGRNLMLHPLGYIEGIFKDNLYSNIGPQGCCMLSQEFYNTRQETNLKEDIHFKFYVVPYL